MPDEAEVVGLLALMLLIESRRAARTAPDGSLVLLADQDRSRWDRGLIAEGQALVRRCLRRGQPGPYQIQAAINAVHSDAAAPPRRHGLGADPPALRPAAGCGAEPGGGPATARSRWPRSTGRPPRSPWLTSWVLRPARPPPGPGPGYGPGLPGYHLFHAIRADLLRRLGRAGEAADAYDAALARTANAAEQAFLRHRRDQLTHPT